MNSKELILQRLLDKYEHSKHFTAPGSSNRRVLLRIRKDELPEYDYQNAAVRDDFNVAVKELAGAGIVCVKWLAGRKDLVAEEIWLNLDHLAFAYRLAGVIPLKERALVSANIFSSAAAQCKNTWAKAFLEEQAELTLAQQKLTVLGKREQDYVQDIITALVTYDQLKEECLTMRGFSIRCYKDSKHFEKNVRDAFLTIAAKHDPRLRELLQYQELKPREKLAILGIFVRPELYEIAGPVTVKTAWGNCDLTALSRTGAALPSNSVEHILGIDMSKIKRVMFIENKTCYDEYVLKYRKSDELAVFHGGFYSPYKGKLLQKIADCVQPGTTTLFWGDIDLGGLQMLIRLRQIFTALLPWKMGLAEVEQFKEYGLKRDRDYLEKVTKTMSQPEYGSFLDILRAIIKYGVTIEQEVMIDGLLCSPQANPTNEIPPNITEKHT
ncbi:MAG: DUF2220 domain-containing protein [Firmicutes bacterium]|nr:DUF2220 domain-containing protein [Bacillota bacterium]